MILYNIRANGPFEYDKFILNIGQLHNESNTLKEQYKESALKKENNIDSYLEQYIQPKETYANSIYAPYDNWKKDKTQEAWLNQLSGLRKAVLL